MIDYNKINEYMATMAYNANGCLQLSTFSIDQILGGYQCITEKDLHKGFEYAIAKNNKEVEENLHATPEQKETEKNKREFILNFFEEQIKGYLKNQNRLL